MAPFCHSLEIKKTQKNSQSTEPSIVALEPSIWNTTLKCSLLTKAVLEAKIFFIYNEPLVTGNELTTLQDNWTKFKELDKHGNSHYRPEQWSC